MMRSHPANTVHQRGVTLVELLIVMVIIGIMASLAYPNYREYVARAKRTEAVTALSQIAINQERFYLSNNTFTTDLTRLGFGASADVLTPSESYVINVTSADAGDFTAVATYQFSDAEASKCLTFQINAAQVKTSAPETDCWSRTR